MSHFYAGFELAGSPAVQIRKDTRVYAHPASARRITDGRCRGVVWMCNPGSAKPLTTGSPSVPWGPIKSDPTLRTILTLYKHAIVGKLPEANDYIAILNCFYICDHIMKRAYPAWMSSGSSYCEPIPSSAAFVVAAWGSEPPFGVVAMSILTILSSQLPVFFHDPNSVPRATVSNILGRMWYPAHPGNRAFTSNIGALAKAIAPFV